ncbi:hypothetical protein PR202_ga28375 [Eleusine coracana subsp. coracana]|uniref:Uncharacterized protein n=1 Tax=Eleusine coracana subsp. coracana TaxID=191504 RepID=A0AAV5DIE2_ELECO|nr:hypothetical protein PR202_ga28375 [Eleusine coracana subsp. coracana]
MLTMESADNCTAIRTESNEFIEELSNMISRNKHKYVAARLLQDLFLHTQVEFRNSELRKLRETLGKVLETIMDPKTDKAELEVLIGLSSQICRVIPDDFGQELEKKNGQGKETFVKLVDALKANMNPTVDCPGIRRVIIEHAIHLMKYGSPHYAVLFNQHGMKEALLTVEQTPSRVERFRIFMGNSGLMEHEEPVTDLVATAKELLMR